MRARASHPYEQVPAYAELLAISNFSFLEGGSHPDELVAQAKAMGLAALGIADRNTVAGVVRAHAAARQVGLRFLPGARLDLRCGTRIACYPTDRAAWGRLCRLLSLGQGRALKGDCHLDLDDVAAHAEGQVLIVMPPEAWDWRETIPEKRTGSSTGEADGKTTATASIIRLDPKRSRLLRKWGQLHSPPGGHLPDPSSLAAAAPREASPKRGASTESSPPEQGRERQFQSSQKAHLGLPC